jgi:hypothetical protein
MNRLAYFAILRQSIDFWNNVALHQM